jgi:hypothetical protein
MSNEDARVWQVSTTGGRVLGGNGQPRPANEQELPPERLHRYREIFASLGLKYGLLRERTKTGEVIFLPFDSLPSGTVDSQEKGIAWASEGPKPVLASLDKTDVVISKPDPAYKHVKGNWYLYWRYNE